MLIIVIPSWQAEAGLSRLLPQLYGERIIVTDGGSTDETLGQAIKGGAVLSLGESGRGAQLRLGGQYAILSGQDEDWFLFLHADSYLPVHWRASVSAAIGEESPRYFKFQADAEGFRARFMDAMVALRCRVLGLPYGDQGLLISRKLYEAVGGYQAMPIFEDVDMVERVRAVSRLRPLGVALRTDVSKYWHQGLWRRGLCNLGLLWRYKRGAPPEILLQAYSK